MENNDAKHINLLVAVSACFYMILLGVNSFVNVFITNTSLDSIALYGVYALVIAAAFPSLLKEKNIRHFVAYFIFVFLSAVSILFYGYGAIGKNVVNFLLTVAPFIFVGASITDTSSLEKYFRVFAFMTAAAAAMHIVGNFIMGFIYVHDMTSAYSVLPAAIMALYYMFHNKKKLIYVLLNIIFFIEILYMGVRGAIVVYFVCILVSLLYFSKSFKTKIITAMAFAVTAVLYFDGTIENGIIEVNSKLVALGIINGAIKRLLEGTITDDSGRNAITQKVMGAVKEHPVVGNGIFSDRVLLGNNDYTHNLISEVLMDFGIIFGTIALVVFAFYLIRLFYLARKDSFRFMFLLSLAALSVGQLLVSGSYLEEPFFFMLIGVMMNSRFFPKKKRRTG
jgi:hypothetical protein